MEIKNMNENTDKTDPIDELEKRWKVNPPHKSAIKLLRPNMATGTGRSIFSGLDCNDADGLFRLCKQAMERDS